MSPTMTSIAETLGKGKGGVQAPPMPTQQQQQRVQPAKVEEKEKKGMKSRFKKAFGGSSSFSSNSLSDLAVDGSGAKQVNGGYRPRRDSSSSSEGRAAPRTPPTMPYATHQSQPSSASIASTVAGDGASTTGGGSGKPPSSRFRLLNPKMNSSTDNISISSTVSSASVMIRKLGQMGKLARRNSLMGLTKAFKKDKNKGDNDLDGAESTFSGLESSGTSPANKLSKKDKKAGKSTTSSASAATTSISRATAEYESPNKTSSSSSSGGASGISPAAALARKHQQAYAEQEAAEARAAATAAAAAEAARLGPPQRSFEQLPQHSKTDSSDTASVRSGRWGRSKTAEDAVDAGGRAQKLEKEKEKLRSRGGKWRLGFGGSKDAEASSVNGDAAAATERTDGDETPRQSLEVLAPPGTVGYPTYGRSSEIGTESEEYEPSLFRQGATPPHQAKAVRGILKGAGSYRQDDFAAPRAPFTRTRAESFDAPKQQGRPGSPGNAALVNVIPSEQQVDGVATPTTSSRTDTHPPSSAEIISNAAIARAHPASSDATTPSSSSPYAHPTANASAPVLAHLTSASTHPTARSASAPGTPGRRIAFAANLSVHTTWPAAIYDRRAELATCNRLTPALAQAIKEELNSFKMVGLALSLSFSLSLSRERPNRC